MSKKTLCLIAAFFFWSPLAWNAEVPKYPVAEIPDSLKANAKAVIRNHEEVFEIKSEGKGTYTVTYAVTVLNENGLDNAIWLQPYSQKLQRVNNIRGAIFDASGKKVENLIQERIVDQSMIAGYSLYEDNRVKYFRPKTMTYPFTAEYSYNVEFDGLFDLPEWSPLPGYNISVQRSSYKVICPPDNKVRYFINEYAGEPIIARENDMTIYEWEKTNLPALEQQPFSGPFNTFSPLVNICPEHFEIEGYSGDFVTWDDFGKWINSVNAERSALPEATVAAMKELVKDCKTDEEKARKIYDYMQSKTRYLNVSVGIGGWQPIPAETVDRLGYGDCKALSNYTKSLLESVGIKAYYTLIRSGDNVPEVVSSFPYNNFNHVILYLPLTEDTVWLECTSQHVPFGYLGKFTDDRKALVINESGAKLVQTCAYSGNENFLSRNSLLVLDNEGNAVLNTDAVYNGVLYDDKLKYYIAGTEDRKRMIHDDVNIPGCILNSFGYEETHDMIPAIKEKLEFELPMYATVSGSRILVSLLPVGRMRDVPKKVTNRKSEVIIKRSVVSVDSVTVVLPEGYEPEAIPSEIKAESDFGSYSLKTMAAPGNKVLCIRTFTSRKGIYSSERYNELVDFCKKVAVSDNMKISLKKSQI
ncbi:MAG TPA: DUF3857 domain-containing transglutaminase family protein [Bacteroidales bacterium]|jgi:transglutaminase-like putative cysteine protease|nr:DUF3857 domain-containing transglutaminase family protein [Bacteroidales bacterium]